MRTCSGVASMPAGGAGAATKSRETAPGPGAAEQQVERGRTGRRRAHLETLALEALAQSLTDIRFVVDQQNALHHRFRGGRRGCVVRPRIPNAARPASLTGRGRWAVLDPL